MERKMTRDFFPILSTILVL